MSLWLVVNSQRPMPVGCGACCSRWIARSVMYSAPSLARQFHLGRLDDVADVVVEGIALVGNDTGNLDVGQLLAEGLHRRARLTVHDPVEVAGDRPGGDRAALDRLEHAGDALAAGL